MKVDVLLGLQWGDEGKGKVVDVLTPNYDVVARFQGGPNAGHTLEFEGQKYVQMPGSLLLICSSAVPVLCSVAGIFPLLPLPRYFSFPALFPAVPCRT